MKLYLVHSMTVLCVLLAFSMLFTSCGKREETAETAVIRGTQPIESVETIMDAVGLR